MRIENGKFYVEKRSKLLSTIRYIPYYSEEQKQWYIIDFGFHILWLGWLGGFAPLFYRFLKLKAYLVDKEDIDSIQHNLFFTIIPLIMMWLSVYPELLLIKNVDRHKIHGDSNLHLNKFFEQHVQLTIVMFIISVSVFFYIIIKCTPNISKNKNYEYLRIKVKVNNIKMFIKVCFPILLIPLVGCLFYFFGGWFIVLSINYTTMLYFVIYLRGFSKYNNIYTGQFIFDNEKHNSIYL